MRGFGDYRVILSLMLCIILVSSVVVSASTMVGAKNRAMGMQDFFAPIFQSAYAVSGTVDASTCNPIFKGTWDAATSTCTIGTITVNSGETMTIPSGTTVKIANSAGTRVTNAGLIDNQGTIAIANNANSGASTGISNSGTINNYGTISIANSDGQFTDNSIGIGHSSGGKIFNYGTITISNVGSIGINTSPGSTFTNNAGASIVITKSAGTAFLGRGDFINSGTITISTTVDGDGISTILQGTFTNNAGASITISNSRSTGGGSHYGLLGGGTFTNAGTITISTVGGDVGGISFSGTFTNTQGASINVSNSDVSTGIHILTSGSFTNYGTIPISNNDSSTGIHAGGSFTNYGTIPISSSGVFGIWASGNVTNIQGASITIANTEGTGMHNTDTIKNEGTIMISNTAGDGIRNLFTSGSGGTITNSGIVTISNTAGNGIRNDAGGIINNPGTIEKCGGTTIGIVPTSGNPVITVITCRPTIVISSPTEGQSINTHTVSVSGTASDPSGLQKVELQVDGGPFALAAGTDTWSYQTSTLSEGFHTLVAKATNTLGFSQSASVSIIINTAIDTISPSVVITSPDHNSFVNDGTPTIGGTASDSGGSGLQKIEVSVDGGSWQLASGKESWSFTAGTLSQGSHYVKARATDNAGNIGYSSHEISTWQAAVTVLGQQDMITKQTSPTSATTLHPWKTAFDSDGNLWVPDGARVVRYSPPFGTGNAANLVLGQTDLTKLVNSPASAATIRGSSAVSVDSVGNVWVADRSAHRILRFEAPFVNGEAATLVLGQPDFTSSAANNGGISARSLNDPYSISFDEAGNLWVADLGNNRVLRYSAPFSIHQAADLVLGQPDFSSAVFVCNSATLNPTANSLCAPDDVKSDSNGNVWVLDRNAQRLIRYSAPFSSYQAADLVLGKPTLTSNEASSLSAGVFNPSQIYDPQSFAFDKEGNVWVANTISTISNVFKFSYPFSNYEAADVILGKKSFEEDAFIPHSSDSDPFSFIGLTLGLTFDSEGNLWISDQDRLLEHVPLNVFIVDTNPPTAQITSPTNNQLVITPALVGIASDPSGIDHIELSVDNGPYTEGIGSAPNGLTGDGSPYSVTFMLPRWSTMPPRIITGLSDGPHTLNIRVTDRAGFSTISDTITVIVDKTAPVTSASPPGGTFSTGQTITLTSNEPATIYYTKDGSVPTTSSPHGASPVTGISISSTTTLRFFAKDAAGNTETVKSQVYTIGDSTPPQITPPPDVVAEATGPLTTVSLGTATAFDLIDGPRPVTSNAPNPPAFPVGVSTVTYTASDLSGNTATATQRVTIQDTRPPVLTTTDIIAEATGPNGAIISFAAVANDLVDGSITATCDHASGITYPIASTTVICSASDSRGNSVSSTFKIIVKDTTAPTITSSETSAIATGAQTPVNFKVSATDAVDVTDPVTCDKTSGSSFPVGSTPVTCTSTDSHGNKATAVFNIVVSHTAAPTITTTDVYAEATGPSGAKVSYVVTASDIVDGNLPVSCTIASGSTFPIATTVVTCTATNSQGTSTSAPFNVVVRDTIGPSLSTADIVVEAAGPSGSPVSFAPTATDAVDGTDPVTCDKVSGIVYPIGTTTVNCSATDSHGNKGTGSFTIKVQDSLGPAVSTPADIIAEATGSSGAAVSYTVSATDLVDGIIPAVCDHASGSIFSFGTVTVQCSATDAHGNKGTGSFAVTVRDTTPPTISTTDLVAEATMPEGAAVTYSVSATDVGDGSVTVNCSPASGNVYSLGTSIVTCNATDSRGNSARAEFTILVQDTLPPTITATHVAAEATGPYTPVSFIVSAHDFVDGNVPVTCDYNSGDSFPLGTTTVSCTASDTRSHQAYGSFDVVISETSAPSIVTSDLVVEATGPSGATVSYTVSATDKVDGTDPVLCDHASGSVFPIGVTEVSCSSTNHAGNTATASFSVKVQDTTPPSITVPANIITKATSPAGAKVSFTVTTSDIVSASVATVCSPASGSQFPMGTTVVTCTATDGYGNSNVAAFQVTVQSPSQMIQDLIALKNSMNLDKGTSTSLGAKLNAAYQSLASGNPADAKSQLTAFINEVNALSGKKMTTAQANLLLTAAQNIIAAIG